MTKENLKKHYNVDANKLAWKHITGRNDNVYFAAEIGRYAVLYYPYDNSYHVVLDNTECQMYVDLNAL